MIDTGILFHPLLQDEPCVAGFPCQSGLTCEAFTQTCKNLANLGEGCAIKACAEGLTCQPGVLKCYNSPRRLVSPKEFFLTL